MKGFKLLLIISMLNIFIDNAGALNGFDISVFSGQVDCFECIKDAGYDLMIIQIFSSKKTFNNDIVGNINAAKQAGIAVDVYIFPDTTQDAQTQIAYFLGYLQDNGVTFDKVWLDVENESLWFPDCKQNVQFLQDLVDASLDFVESPFRVGIYASNRYWEPIMCGSTNFSNYFLWWPRYDSQKNFDSFVPFGGWDIPYMQQYLNEVAICCANTDLDWNPSF